MTKTFFNKKYQTNVFDVSWSETHSSMCAPIFLPWWVSLYLIGNDVRVPKFILSLVQKLADDRKEYLLHYTFLLNYVPVIIGMIC